jgi:glycosyltransferase involved in cell wall biosynthesis
VACETLSDSPEKSGKEVVTLANVTAIVPARDEEAVIATCVESLAIQPELSKIIVVNDQSSDETAAVVRKMVGGIERLELIDAPVPSSGAVGKNNALSAGARRADTAWLLFVDADVELQDGAVGRALQIADENDASMVSFSPEQITRKWYEKALIPFVFCRLARRFSFDEVNDPKSLAAAANGQFLMIRREVYKAVGGHASVAGEVLEDVALAKAAKKAGHRLWFGSGKGIVRARMYRSFGAMWEGWKKNLYPLMGEMPWRVFREGESAFPWIPFLLIALSVKFPPAVLMGVLLLSFRQAGYGVELKRNGYARGLIFYYVPAVFLYVGVLAASYRSYRRGKVSWKGREYRVGSSAGR